MELPKTLHGQLYLLAYDRDRKRFDPRDHWLLGFALRAAILTELSTSGHLRDTDGKAHPAGGEKIRDPLLKSVFREVSTSGPKEWAWLVAANQASAPRHVREQLTDEGWLREQRCRRFGIFLSSRVGPHDEHAVGRLARRVSDGVWAALAGRSVDQRVLTLGMLAAVAQMSTVVVSEDDRLQLAELAAGAIAPIVGLQAAVASVQTEVSEKSSCGGGCGGGCGGCGGCGG